MGPACPGLGSGAGEWATGRLGRRRLPLSTRQRANGRPGEISMCPCTSTRTDISPLACTAENSMDLSALSKSPARCRMLAQGRAPEDADVVSAKAWRSEAHVGLDIGRPRLGEANPAPPVLR